MESRRGWQTVVETTVYLADAVRLFSEAQRDAIVRQVATEPGAGDVIQGTGGLRKMRVGARGRGKRGGARVIYFFHSEGMPLYLLAVYAKNERSDLSKAQEAAFRKLCEAIVADHKRRK